MGTSRGSYHARGRRGHAFSGGLARAFGASLDLRATFEQVAQAVRPVLGFDGMGVRLLADSGRDMELVGRVSDPPTPAAPSRIPFDDLSFAATVQAGTPVCIRDAQRDLGPRIGRGECGLSRDARSLLLAHRWPGNIRELQNAVERALIVAEGGLLTAAHFGLGITRTKLYTRLRQFGLPLD